jgi:hypothetical protein
MAGHIEELEVNGRTVLVLAQHKTECRMQMNLHSLLYSMRIRGSQRDAWGTLKLKSVKLLIPLDLCQCTHSSVEDTDWNYKEDAPSHQF